MGRKRGRGNAYTQEFKADAVKLVQVNGRQVPEVAADLGISDQTLYRWLKDLNDSKDGTKVKLRENEVEIRHLKKEIADLKDTVTVLKKSVAIFSKP